MIRVRDTRVSAYKILKPEDCSKGVVRVGPLLKFMDICACLSAERLSKASSVTLSMDTLTFEAEACEGDTICVIAQVTRAFNTSVEILVVVLNEDLECTICSAFFVFVSIKDGKKVPLPSAFPETELEQMNFVAANDRRTARINAVQLLERAKKGPSEAEESSLGSGGRSMADLIHAVPSASTLGSNGNGGVNANVTGTEGRSDRLGVDENQGIDGQSLVVAPERFVRADESLVS
jgi:acyl-CoA hydrolase